MQKVARDGDADWAQPQLWVQATRVTDRCLHLLVIEKADLPELALVHRLLQGYALAHGTA